MAADASILAGLRTVTGAGWGAGWRSIIHKMSGSGGFGLMNTATAISPKTTISSCIGMRRSILANGSLEAEESGVGRLARAVMVLGGTAILVAMPREDYARLGANSQTAAMRAYALFDRHVVSPIQVAFQTASPSWQEPDVAAVPKPRPAIRPSLLGEDARRGLEDVRIPDVKPEEARTRMTDDASTAEPVGDAEPARPGSLQSGNLPATRAEANADTETFAKATEAAPPVVSPVPAGADSSIGTADIPPPAATPAADASQTVSAIDSDRNAVRSDSAVEDRVAKAKFETDPDNETAHQPPVPSEKPEASADKKPPPAAKLLFGAAKTAAPLAARAIGFYSRGCLAGGKALPVDGPAWQAMRLTRNRNWGHPELIALIERFAKEVQKEDGWPGLLIGDMSQPRGGPMLTGHASHQVGLDADIWFTPMPGRRLSRREREALSATSMILGPTQVDPTAFTQNHVRVVKRAASYPQVERVLVHPAIKKALCEAAGNDRKWLGKVRPYFGHFYHFHMRIGCPKDSKDCRRQPAPDGDDGCGKELDDWFKRLTRPAPPRPKDAKPMPPKPPITLADMPKECRVVLEAGGGPKVEDEAELVKSSIERSQKIIDISGEPRAEALARGAPH